MDSQALTIIKSLTRVSIQQLARDQVLCYIKIGSFLTPEQSEKCQQQLTLLKERLEHLNYQIKQMNFKLQHLAVKQALPITERKKNIGDALLSQKIEADNQSPQLFSRLATIFSFIRPYLRVPKKNNPKQQQRSQFYLDKDNEIQPLLQSKNEVDMHQIDEKVKFQ